MFPQDIKQIEDIILTIPLHGIIIYKGSRSLSADDIHIALTNVTHKILVYIMGRALRPSLDHFGFQEGMSGDYLEDKRIVSIVNIQGLVETISKWGTVPEYPQCYARHRTVVLAVRVMSL